MQDRTVQVGNLSPRTTEKDVKDFFSYSGTVHSVQLERAGEWAQVALVTFKEPHSVDFAVMLSGATIMDRQVCIVPWGGSEESVALWKKRAKQLEEEGKEPQAGHIFPSSPGHAVNMAQQIVTTMMSKGYVLGKDALSKAKALDEKHRVTASAAANVVSLGQKMGINDRISAGYNMVRGIDHKYGVSDKGKVVGEKSKAVLVAAGQTMSSAGTAIVNSSYFSSGALWVSGALNKAAKSAADLGARASAVKK